VHTGGSSRHGPHAGIRGQAGLDPETGHAHSETPPTETPLVKAMLASLDSNYFAWAAALAPMVMGNPQEPELAEDLRVSFYRTNPSIARHFAGATFFSDTRPELRKLRTRSLILQCSDDRLAPPEVGAYLHKNLEHSTLAQLHATGHRPHLSAPQETARTILHYLNTRP
jgi:sigma-B regulation protein RsbQ